ncbi:phage tail protein [Paenibacillus sp. GCM10027626]|uniref:phage tail-collar fiber domain-containing protein n=1 Tax=Paenibacillus sp. GCM10027626 TaxID=3273411 RepID=UPI00362628BE
MGALGGFYITNKGRALQAKAQIGTPLQYTRVAVGDGNLGSQSIADLTGLISPKKTLEITDLKTRPGGRAVVSTKLTNQGISTGFYLREMGLFAKDPDEGEILYCYANAGAGAEYIPPTGGPDVVEQIYNINTIVGNATNVSAIIDESLVFATKEDLNEHRTKAVLDHPDGSVIDSKIGDRTISDTAAPTSDKGKLSTLLGWLANMIKSITGESSWRTLPAMTIKEIKTVLTDVSDNLDAHKSFTSVHGATAAATANRMPIRDANGQFKVGAPIDPDHVARKDTVDNAVTDGMARQAIINGNFDIWQRGVRFILSEAMGAYTADRFYFMAHADGGTLPAITHTREESSPVANSRYFYRLGWDGPGSNLGQNVYHSLNQHIENGIRYLSARDKNTQVTVSFFARTNIPNKRIGVFLQQSYGTGGSPSAPNTIRGQNFTLTSNWVRYSVTFNQGPYDGKIFGSNGDDRLRIALQVAWGTSNAADVGATTQEGFGGPGQVDIIQVQVSAGEAALPFQPRTFAEELAMCQRYYEKSYDVEVRPGTSTLKGETIGTGIADSNGVADFGFQFAVRKRVAPTITYYAEAGTVNTVGSFIDGSTFQLVSVENGNYPFQNSRGSGVRRTGLSPGQAASYYFHWTADAEL